MILELSRVFIGVAGGKQLEIIMLVGGGGGSGAGLQSGKSC